MRVTALLALLGTAALPCLLPTLVHAQPQAPLPKVYTPTSAAAPRALDEAALRRLVAPVALYPDTLMASILAASTHPAQIVEAQRFLTDPAQAGLPLNELVDAAAPQGWDPSVMALLAFPEVVRQLDEDLSWTEHLGQAFAAQQTQVLDAVQALRRLAQQDGALTTGPNDSVVNNGADIEILPPSPQDVFLPDYNAACVFGPAPGCGSDQNTVGWLGDAVLPFGYLQGGALDWRRRAIRPGAGPHEGAPAWRHEMPRGLAFAPVAHPYVPPARVIQFAPVSRGGFGARPAPSMMHAAPVPHAVMAAPFVGLGRH